MADELVFHDEVELEDFEWDEEAEVYHYPCPCGDRYKQTVFVTRFKICVTQECFYMVIRFNIQLLTKLKQPGSDSGKLDNS